MGIVAGTTRVLPESVTSAVWTMSEAASLTTRSPAAVDAGVGGAGVSGSQRRPTASDAGSLAAAFFTGTRTDTAAPGRTAPVSEASPEPRAGGDQEGGPGGGHGHGRGVWGVWGAWAVPAAWTMER